MTATIAVIAGYVASLALAISLMVNNDLKFRWLNTIGCISFILYGVLIGAFPVILTNGILLCINLYYLIRIYNTREDFDVIAFQGEEKLMAKFLSFYDKDIKGYFPQFNMATSKASIRFVVIRDIVVANVFVADLLPDGTALVELNYTVPKYRDYKVGLFLFEQDKTFLLSLGVRRIRYDAVHNANHRRFLRSMGFTEKDGVFEKQL